MALVFTGQGAQRPGMGAGLAAAFPVFAPPWTRRARHWTPSCRGRCGTCCGAPAPARLAGTGAAQPALFAVEVALYRLLEAAGITPAVLAGHSVGEIAAAHVAGALSLADAAVLVTARGQLMGALPAGGAMIAVQASEEQVAPLLGPGVALAAVNGPRSVVLSGDQDAVTAAAAACGGRSRRLAVSHAFHSPRIDPMLAEFRRVLATLAYHPPQVPVISALDGQPAALDAAYWAAQARGTVRYTAALDAIAALGATVLIEAGPDAVLAPAATDARPGATAIATQRKDRDEAATLTAALAAIHVHATPVHWTALHPATPPPPPAPLPTYAFQHHRYWLTTTTPTTTTTNELGLVATDHPLLGAAVPLAAGTEVMLTGGLSTGTQAGGQPGHRRPAAGARHRAGRAGHPGPGRSRLRADRGADLEAPMVLPDRGGATSRSRWTRRTRQAGGRSRSMPARTTAARPDPTGPGMPAERWPAERWPADHAPPSTTRRPTPATGRPPPPTPSS